MSLKVKIGSAVAALALVGAVGVSPANASTGATVNATVTQAWTATAACWRCCSPKPTCSTVAGGWSRWRPRPGLRR